MIINPVPSIAYDTYWKFACLRQEIFYKKIKYPLAISDDPIIATYKFTNAYRVLDRVSQYLVKNVIYSCKDDSDDTVFRILFFKLFNKIETWELIESAVGEINIDNFDINKWDQILTAAKENGRVLYSNAYMMASGSGGYNVKYKHSSHLHLLGSMLEQELPKKIQDSASMEQVFNLLISYPLIGSFLAYQYATDINYSNVTFFSEDEFTVPGPGAKDGIRKCFSEYSGYSGNDLIRYMYDRQDLEFERLGLKFNKIGGRRLQLIDIQNLFCEFDKYCRMAHPDIKGVSKRTKIKQKYNPKSEGVELFFPPKWNLNMEINHEY
jgi:hypothetical protein